MTLKLHLPAAINRLQLVLFSMFRIRQRLPFQTMPIVARLRVRFRGVELLRQPQPHHRLRPHLLRPLQVTAILLPTNCFSQAVEDTMSHMRGFVKFLLPKLRWRTM